jgi:hypothetical protein
MEGEFDPASLAVPRGNGNGNRWKNSNRAGGERGATPNANSVPNNGPERLRIFLEETDDREEDEERLRSLVNALREYEGEGAVHLSIQQRDGEQVEMELPRARYCPELEQRLGQIVGPWGTVGA